ncbi:MAG: D-glucuronyl C5-epimerase family protein, partial [Candidatus Marinimicrobia bacterium]|nr:D-glucuronyl C5-epimerase family protein [Candidatus Neomarinimicrobiota bacterium]
TDLKSAKVEYKISHDLKSNQLSDYYFIFQEKRVSEGKDQALISNFDKNGIPINKTYIDVKDKEFVYFPITIGQVGLAVFHTYLETKSENDRNRFMKFVDWFYNNAEFDENLGIRWLTDVSLPQYKNPDPWQSAFSQSRGISILLRGYQLTGNEKYAEMAEKALISFTKSVDDGGVTSFTKWGPFYEEYTAKVPTLVLNGMIFSLCGVYDFVRVFSNNKLAKKIFDDGIETLKNILPEYDLNYWSKYNLCEANFYPKIDPATVGYQRLHITQLKMLYKLTGEKIFNNYAQMFKKQINIFNILKMYIVKYKALKKLNRI